MNRKCSEFEPGTPVVVQREADWFAVSPPEATLRIGVEAASEAEARQRFAREAEAWARLAALPLRAGAGG